MTTTKNSMALITGGSRGLGRAAALALAESGADVIITWRGNADAADAVVHDIKSTGRRAAGLQLDVTQSDTFPGFVGHLENLLGEWQRTNFDYLVNNAGFGVHASFEETSEADFDSLMNVHLKGPFFLTQKLLPLIADGGRILNVSSALARFAIPGYAAYAIMKGGVEVMTRYLAKELGARGIVANTLAPGAIETDFGGGVVRDNSDLNQFVASQTALGRAGLPGDIGGVIASLLSSESGWINAQRIEASGGMFI
jgi:NAD(P)-dependent dehydrogenase (short-subunit alcohol dehydrogenase family)